MDIKRWQKKLAKLPLESVHLYQRIPSTNDAAAELAERGSGDLTLVAADEQTAGRGRQERTWITRQGQALAFSLIMIPESEIVPAQILARFSGLGALAVTSVLQAEYQLPARIKWPNDVLIRGRKAAGVLVDVRWSGSRLQDLILGIGVNVTREAVPEPDQLRFPATSLEAELEAPVNRLELLYHLLEALLELRTEIHQRDFVDRLENLLAYRGEQVILKQSDRVVDRGKLLGLAHSGELQLERDSGEIREYPSGEIQLRLVDNS